MSSLQSAFNNQALQPFSVLLTLREESASPPVSHHSCFCFHFSCTIQKSRPRYSASRRNTVAELLFRNNRCLQVIWTTESLCIPNGRAEQTLRLTKRSSDKMEEKQSSSLFAHCLLSNSSRSVDRPCYELDWQSLQKMKRMIGYMALHNNTTGKTRIDIELASRHDVLRSKQVILVVVADSAMSLPTNTAHKAFWWPSEPRARTIWAKKRKTGWADVRTFSQAPKLWRSSKRGLFHLRFCVDILFRTFLDFSVLSFPSPLFVIFIGSVPSSELLLPLMCSGWPQSISIDLSFLSFGLHGRL